MLEIPLTPEDEFWWASPSLKTRLKEEPAQVLKDRGINPPAQMPLPVVHEFIRTMYLLWVNGRVQSIEDFRIDPADEGLLFGRGVWESTRTVQGIPWLWNWHLERMVRTSELLSMPLKLENLPTVEQVSTYVRLLSKQDVIIRLNATAGRPGQPGLVWMSAMPRPTPMPYLRLKTMLNPVQKGQAYLALKTFQYATRLRIGQDARRAGFDSALMLDSEGFVQEAAHANIFFRLPDGWVTPVADGGFLPGTVRQYLLENSPLRIREVRIPLASVKDAREVFVTNSNYGIVPVTQIDEQTFPTGTETESLIRWLHPPEPPGVQYRFMETTPTPR